MAYQVMSGIEMLLNEVHGWVHIFANQARNLLQHPEVQISIKKETLESVSILINWAWSKNISIRFGEIILEAKDLLIFKIPYWYKLGKLSTLSMDKMLQSVISSSGYAGIW